MLFAHAVKGTNPDAFALFFEKVGICGEKENK
jgi:hypothetical protein